MRARQVSLCTRRGERDPGRLRLIAANAMPAKYGDDHPCVRSELPMSSVWSLLCEMPLLLHY